MLHECLRKKFHITTRSYSSAVWENKPKNMHRVHKAINIKTELHNLLIWI